MTAIAGLVVFDEITASEDSPSIAIPKGAGYDSTRIIQIAATGDGQVQVQGRVHPDAAWFDIGTPLSSSDTLLEIRAPNFIRLSCTVTTGNVSAWIGG